jgi:hypothetical protein
MGEEDRVRRLAELKAYLEKRTHDLEQELLKLKSLEDIVDVVLAEKSFRRVEVPKSHVPSTTSQVTPLPVVEAVLFQTVPIKTTSGVELADMQVNQNEVKVIPKPDMKFDSNAPPLRAFLIGRVLEPMKLKDKSALEAGQITEDKVLSYRVEQEGNVLRQIVVTNYGDERRLQELRSAISWTLRRMYERITGTK